MIYTYASNELIIGDTVLTGGYVSILNTGMFESALCVGHVTINCGVVVSILFLSIQSVSK